MLGGWLWCGLALCAWGQIDPVERHLLQFGYNQSLRGNSPLAGYAFYYLNEPGFWRTNLTLRLAVAPVYLDSELVVAKVFGENTDLGVGLAGGGFADTYSEIRGVYPLERQAGVDVARLRQMHPQLIMMGGYDKMVMSQGEAPMRAEFERLLPVMRSGGFIPSVDHQTPPGVSLDNYKIYMRLFREYCERAVR